jgi:hypothetical protein
MQKFLEQIVSAKRQNCRIKPLEFSACLLAGHRAARGADPLARTRWLIRPDERFHETYRFRAPTFSNFGVIPAKAGTQ